MEPEGFGGGPVPDPGFFGSIVDSEVATLGKSRKPEISGSGSSFHLRTQLLGASQCVVFAAIR